MDLNAVPRFSPGCRPHPADDILLVPEGALNLEGPAREILIKVNGSRSVQTIVDELHQEYAAISPEDIAKDVLDLLTRLQSRGVVRI